MVENTLPIVLQILQTAGLLVGIIYYIVSMRNQTKTRQAQLFMSLHRESIDYSGMLRYREFMYMEWDDYEDFERKYGSDNNPEAFATRHSWWLWYHDLGLLVKKGLINMEMVYDFLGSSIISDWKKWEPIIIEVRKIYMGENFLEYWEYLAERMTSIQNERGIKWEFPETGYRYISDTKT